MEDGATAAIPPAPSSSSARTIGGEGRHTPQHQQQPVASVSSPTSAGIAAAAIAVPPIHESGGFRVGSRVAERLTLKCCRMPEQRECVKFVCKDLWHFLFQKQADRLQTNRRGGYVVHDASLPWLRRVHPLAASLPPATAGVRKGCDAIQQQHEEELLRTAATQPQLHVAFVCGAIRGALAALGLECTVTAEASRPPSCAFQIRISS
ncbi:transport protein particle component bet3 domain-containing protein [Cyclospora cayetanensis]|uniref:Transport protein particle component bet3 domain-containing protein n=1 Tax=Cyclospora cayetanensis TaxID=88456 RepID=A0A1D3CW72_9EIME|nr:transport protein particle component bet3 domain-containing protein [Cyclospora cayetanensis]